LLRISTIVICILITSLVLVGAQEGETPLVTATPILDIYAFPTGLFCSKIDMNGEVAPVWGEIQIGKSSIDDLHTYVTTLSNLYQTEGIKVDRISYFISPSRLAEQQQVPTRLTACVIDGVVWLVQVSMYYDNNPYTLVAFVQKYGLPDVVTWSESPQTRLVFWFEFGIMAEVNIDKSRDILSYEDILSIVYFPVQDIDGFQNRYPFNLTRTTPAFTDEILRPPLSTDQNPFNFSEFQSESSPVTPTPTLDQASSSKEIEILSGIQALFKNWIQCIKYGVFRISN
jgi:hypothetical protein